jgi:enoyl-CoA hydratase/carnithine racemase
MAITLDKSDGLARIVIDRPEARNAMDAKAYQDLHRAIRDFREDANCSVALLTGAGEHFTIGGDMTSYVATPVEEWRKGPPPYSIDLNAAMWECPKPIIVAVRGFCVGWGMVALASGDLRLIAEGSRLGYSGALRFFGGAGSGGFIERLMLQVPYVRAMELLLTGKLVTAGEALEYGLVNEVVPAEQLDERAEETARAVMSMPPMVMRTIKSAARRVQRQLVDVLAETTDREGRLYFHSQDFGEGLRAWDEKRDPVWTGR